MIWMSTYDRQWWPKETIKDNQSIDRTWPSQPSVLIDKRVLWVGRKDAQSLGVCRPNPDRESSFEPNSVHPFLLIAMRRKKTTSFSWPVEWFWFIMQMKIIGFKWFEKSITRWLTIFLGSELLNRALSRTWSNLIVLNYVQWKITNLNLSFKLHLLICRSADHVKCATVTMTVMLNLRLNHCMKSRRWVHMNNFWFYPEVFYRKQLFVPKIFNRDRPTNPMDSIPFLVSHEIILLKSRDHKQNSFNFLHPKFLISLNPLVKHCRKRIGLQR